MMQRATTTAEVQSLDVINFSELRNVEVLVAGLRSSCGGPAR